MYIHLDCNNFFVSCELVSRPELKGTPVVVANNNDNNGGIILALNQEAKAVGLKRGNPIFQVTKIIELNHVTVIDVHHQLYHDISHHIMDEVRKTEMVLNFIQYSVDEFFGENEGLLMAEVELTSPNEPYLKPAFIGEEVTGDTRYYNSFLRRTPYKSWKQD